MKFKRYNSEQNMGLDQYAYVAAQAGDYDGYYENNNVTKPRELAYWRKHPNLQGWMEQLWLKKGGTTKMCPLSKVKKEVHDAIEC